MGGFNLNPESATADQVVNQAVPQAPQPQAPPTQQPQPDQIKQGLDTAAQYYQQQLQANTPKPPSGGPIRSLLQNFFSGMGQSMMSEAGLPTPYEKQQKAVTGLQGVANAQGMLDLHQQMASQYAPVPLVGLDGKPVTGPDGKVIALPANHAATWYAGQAAAGARVQAAEVGTHKPINVPGVGAFNWDDQQNKYVPVQGTQGATPTVDHDTATLAGVPQLADQPANAQAWSTINKALQAKGYRVQDMGSNGTGPNQGMWLLDRAGSPVKQVSPNSLTYQRGASFAQTRAAYTPFETVEPGTNTPTTISNLQALRSGAPKVSVTQASTLGGKYAQFNDAYGILDNIDRMVGNKPGQVNFEDPAVRARVSAGYAAIKDPASKGLTGEILSNFLARQPIGASLQPNERELVLNMAQGKAAATGLRGILGQAGSNEMQQRLDAGLFPGGQAVGSNDAIKQQTKATRSLLDRFVVGQPGVGLNAPNTSTSLKNNMKSQTPQSGGGFAAWKASQNAR